MFEHPYVLEWIDWLTDMRRFENLTEEQVIEKLTKDNFDTFVSIYRVDVDGDIFMNLLENFYKRINENII